jgi:hypothetical protein
MATIADSGGSVNKTHNLGDDIRELTFAAFTLSHTSAVIDTTGWDYLTYNVGAGTLTGGGTTSFTLRASNDAAGTATGLIAVEAGVHAVASVGAASGTRVMGYLKVLPRYLVVVPSGGSTTSIALTVTLRKKRTYDRGR